MSLFWSKNALFWSEMHHMLSYSVVLYCTVFLLHCSVYFLLPYGIAWYCIVWFGILCYLFCILLRFSLRRAGFVSQDAYSLHPPIRLSPPIRLIWIIWLSRPIRMNPPFWLSPPIRLILIIRIIQLNPSIRLVICYLSLVIGHLSFGFFYLSFVYLLFVALLFIALLGIYFVTLWYYMVLHCMIWYFILSILHSSAFFASSRGLCLARRLFP